MSDDYLNKPLSFGSGSDLGLAPAPSKSTPSFTSPYLNYDQRYMRQAQPEFIFPEGASKQRGRFELAFSQIGSSVMVGAAVGGVGGLYNGVKATALAQQTGKLRRTQILNHVMKQGAGTANTLGTIAVLYSAFGVLLSWARGEDDEINTIAAGTATGLMYKSTAGLRRCAIGGGIGLALSSAWVLYNMSSSKFNKNQYI
ncbi:hypothetical protein PVAND_005627 [Polypedilum vanderplanki]|uniref:Mitochondrial import inner membrane translocase subunit Tim23 n=1 Tax=Polypedilum vanderplanki TaxID=319348 RepID=A0A9J6C1L3_POLVA|nr:hypothetical protein PVAND_005627 [Polypedilum vanderplanki]